MNQLEELKDKAKRHSRSGNYRAGLQICEELIRLEPEDPMNWVRAGSNLQRLGQHTKALEYYNRATELDPEESLAWIGRGISLFHLDEISEAIASHGASIRLSPSFPALTLRAACHMRRAVDKLSLAVEYLKRGDIDDKTSYEKGSIADLTAAVSDLRRAEEFPEADEGDDTVDVLLAIIRHAETGEFRAEELKRAVESLVAQST